MSVEERFRITMAARGVSAAGADAILVRVREAGAAVRIGAVSNWQGQARVNAIVSAVERKTRVA